MAVENSSLEAQLGLYGHNKAARGELSNVNTDRTRAGQGREVGDPKSPADRITPPPRPQFTMMNLNRLVSQLATGEPKPAAEIQAVYGEASGRRAVACLLAARAATSCIKSTNHALSSPELLDEMSVACATFGNIAFRLFGNANLAFAADLFLTLVAERLGWADGDPFEVSEQMVFHLRNHPHLPEGEEGRAKLDRIIAGFSRAYTHME